MRQPNADAVLRRAVQSILKEAAPQSDLEALDYLNQLKRVRNDLQFLFERAKIPGLAGSDWELDEVPKSVAEMRRILDQTQATGEIHYFLSLQLVARSPKTDQEDWCSIIWACFPIPDTSDPNMQKMRLFGVTYSPAINKRTPLNEIVLDKLVNYLLKISKESFAERIRLVSQEGRWS